MSRTAIVLFNLGGPDSLEAVEPFLFNLFSDPAILPPPNPIRWLLARTIARRRTPVAREIYAGMGGRSPLLENTQAQAQALADALADLGDPGELGVFIAMRYWHPRAAATVRAVKEFGPDRVLLLPLYPQFSTTSTGTSFQEWVAAATRAGLEARTQLVCCHATASGFLSAMAEPTVAAIREGLAVAPVRVLLSAHGLPERVIRRGDPYRWQVERTARALEAAVQRRDPDLRHVDWRVSFQSRATPEAWLQPDTEAEVRAAGAERRAVVVVPVAFVSEHSETLVELDEEYAATAKASGVPVYRRVPTPGTAPDYVATLSQLVRRTLASDASICSEHGNRICPSGFAGCPNVRAR